MPVYPYQIVLDITPRSRFDIIDVKKRAFEKMDGTFKLYRKAAYCSHHTTAGFLEQSLCSRLQYQKERISSYIKAFKELFPKNATYHHDIMEQRTE
jgi:hypothetical protein